MRCADCGEEKDAEDFPRHKGYKSGRGKHCKPCHNRRNRETVRRLHGNSRHYHLMQKYGISASQVEAMKAAQDGLCAVCLTRAAVHVDHDHGSGRVRAILCESCNGFLGAFSDDPQLLQAAIAYLEKPR